MAKIADRYFKKDSWKIIEEGFDPAYSEVAESVFSLGNEYMGVRGSFEEGYSGETLTGNYFNGIYERTSLQKGYKGSIDSLEYMINSVNWLAVKLQLDDEVLDLNVSKFKDFKRELDLRTGVLTRSFIWVSESGKELRLTFERFLSMKKARIGGQKITLKPVNFNGTVKVSMILDFSSLHKSAGKNLWTCPNRENSRDQLNILGVTETTMQRVFSCCQIFPSMEPMGEIAEEKKIGNTYELFLTEGEETVIGRVVENLVLKNPANEAAFLKEMEEVKAAIGTYCYETLKEESTSWWKKNWERSDIQIRGDDWNQQGIRYCIFQMYQTYHGVEPGNNIGAKGLTGEAYNGNTFWDTETYYLPFYIFNDVDAKNLLMFRYLTLDAARERAKALDCKGAFYPVATISGTECCNLWQHASLQLQASTAVSYGIWFYVQQTGDKAFLYQYGLEMLIEICRMLATRGAFSEGGSKYGYYCVMGPDEFQMMVNHNAYTNYMAQFTFDYTLNCLKAMKEECGDEYFNIKEKLSLTEDETLLWKEMSDKMYLPYDEETKLFEQHDGFFRLPHINIHDIPVEDFPLYNHWSYDRIYRNDMIKQPDVLMFLFLLNSNFSEEQIRANYEYYEPRCIHESSLSPSVHSILASQIKRHEEAYHLFEFATRLDLDNYNRNTNEGLHIPSIAAAWMNIIYGFGGMRSDRDRLSFSPSVPKAWDGYSFRIVYRGEVLLAEVEKTQVSFRVTSGAQMNILVYDSPVSVGKEAVTIAIPEEWRG